MTFQTICFKGFEVLVTARATDGYSVGTVYLEMAGAEAEVKAIWSRLVSAKVKKSGRAEGVTIGNDTVGLQQKTKYFTLRSVLANGMHVVALVHPRATIVEQGAAFYIVVPTDCEGPPPGFFSRLASALAVPVKEEWADWLWQKGQHTGKYEYQQLIRKLPSSGHVEGYAVVAQEPTKWLKLIQEGLGFKVCDWCSKPVKELVERVEIKGYGPNRRDVIKMICEECNDGQEEKA